LPRFTGRTSGHLFAVILRIQRDRTAGRRPAAGHLRLGVEGGREAFDAARSQPMTWLVEHRAQPRHRQPAPRRPRSRAWKAHPRRRRRATRTLSRPQADDAARPARTAGPCQPQRASSTRCVQHLSPPQRQSVAMAFFDGLSHAEMAEHLTQPLGTVKSWVRRALNALRTCLERVLPCVATLPPDAEGA
jgi:hypothetical protein